MKKTALRDDILQQIEKPARYIGGEINAVMKDPANVDVRFAMCFPDIYEIGMSHLGLQILYHMFNMREDTWCERVFSPWLDLDEILRKEAIPLFALESQDPVKDFDFLGITLQYEMCYTNVLQILDLSRIPLRAADRGEGDPIVIGGGPCAYNPEPLAEFFDLFYIGEGETAYDALLDVYIACKNKGQGREAFLREAARIEGIYVPGFYEACYGEDGLIRSFAPVNDAAKPRIRKQAVSDLSSAPFPTEPVVPFLRATQDRMMLEIQRGCIRGCRFCQAGMIYRPLREKALGILKEQAAALLQHTGHEEISLTSLSSSDYTGLGELTAYLIEAFQGKGVNISLPSLRIDAFSLEVMGKIQDVRKSSLTFAPEAGTQRLRDVINKGLTEEEILRGASEAFVGGWSKVKLYFMLGLPTETEEDVAGIAALAEKIAGEYYWQQAQRRSGRCQITVSASFFVPKPFTPFQWASMDTQTQFLEKSSFLKDAIRSLKNRKSIRFSWHEADVAVLEGVLARGDRRVGRAIALAYQKGCLFDSWSECFDGKKWDAAFVEAEIDPAFYTSRQREADEILPWDFIDIGVTKSFLRREYEKALRGETTPNCREHCSGCGANTYGGGICVEH